MFNEVDSSEQYYNIYAAFMLASREYVSDVAHSPNQMHTKTKNVENRVAIALAHGMTFHKGAAKIIGHLLEFAFNAFSNYRAQLWVRLWMGLV